MRLRRAPARQRRGVRQHGPVRRWRQLQQRLAQQRFELRKSQTIGAALDPDIAFCEGTPGGHTRHIDAEPGRMQVASSVGNARAWATNNASTDGSRRCAAATPSASGSMGARCARLPSQARTMPVGAPASPPGSSAVQARRRLRAGRAASRVAALRSAWRQRSDGTRRHARPAAARSASIARRVGA